VRTREAELHALKIHSGKLPGIEVADLDLSTTVARERYRDFITRRFEMIVLNTEAGSCDIYLHQGVRLMGFPLRKQISQCSLVSACEYMDDGALFF